MAAPFKPLALTMGEPGGVGPEIANKAWRTLRADGPVFFVIGDPHVFDVNDASIERIETPEEARTVFPRALPVIADTQTLQTKPGVAAPETANAVIRSIEQAVAIVLGGRASGVVTNPVQKSALYAAGFSFPGHTEFLEALTTDAPMPDHRTRGAVMMLAGPDLRTVPVTIHQSVRDAVATLSPDVIVRTATITAEALRHDFAIAAPRLAISGLNPHAGEGGALGAEDEMIIAPAVDKLRAAGLDAKGPLPADTMFHAEARAHYDAALCMLHDQALIPAKTLAFHDAVNVTLGLPIIRTSPDHGVALDIAGKGVARADSLVAAIRLAADMAARRVAPSDD
ncbi:MAG: 4-hydroxythreonine-4-phosphate dehydrogenase PdxA [Pseudomonadota bacterium]